MMTRKLLLILGIVFYFTSSSAQSFKLVHDSVNPRIIDTPIHLYNRIISGFIAGHTIVMPQNTVFFNKEVVMDKCQVDTVHTNWVFFENLFIINSILTGKAIFDSTNANLFSVLKSEFRNGLLLKGSDVQYFSFKQNTAEKAVYFENSTFKESKFDSSVFKKELEFRNCSLGESSLKGIRILDKIKFSDCNVKNVRFDNSFFAGASDFTSLKFEGHTSFDYCELKARLTLAKVGMTPNTSFSFVGTLLPDTLDLSNNPGMANVLDFTKADFSKRKSSKICLFLYQTDVSKLKLNYKHFKLVFKMSDKEPDISNDEKATIYENLLQNFKNQAFSESYRDLDIEYQRFRAKNSKIGFLWWIPEYWWNYGYNREWVFYWTFTFLLIFTVINFFFLPQLIKGVYHPGEIPVTYKAFLRIPPAKYRFPDKSAF